MNKKLNICLLSDATLPKMQYVCFCFQIGGNCATESNASDIFEPRSKTFSAQHDFFHNFNNCIVSSNLSQTMMNVGCMYAPVDAHLIVVWEYTLLHRINRAQEWPDCHCCRWGNVIWQFGKISNWRETSSIDAIDISKIRNYQWPTHWLTGVGARSFYRI